MIYSDAFVWLHFPKCAGTKIERLFEKYFSGDNGIVQDLIGVQNDPSVAWHDSVAQRESRDPRFLLGSRTVICSFRRLPSWLESRYAMEYDRSPQLDHRLERLLEGKFLEQTGLENHADRYAMKYLPKPILESDKLRFIRTEYFEADFKSVFGDYVDVSIIPDWEFNKRENASKSYIPLDIKKRLSDNQHRLYEQCPYWKIVEDLAYGSTT